MREFESGQLQKQLFGAGFSAREDWGEVRAFGNLLRAILRRKRMIAAFAVLGALMGLGLASVQERRYISSAQVMIDTRVERDRVLPTAEAVLPITVTALESELEVLRSLDLVDRVIEALRLDQDPEFVPALRNTDPLPLIGQIRDWAEGWLGRDGRDAMPAAEAASLDRRKLIETVDKRRAVKQTSTLSAVFEMSFASEDREKAVAIANTFAEEYLEMQMAMKQGLLGRAESLLTRRRAEIDTRLATLRRELDRQVLLTPFAGDDSLQEARGARDELAQRIEAARKRGAYDQVEALTPGFIATNRRLAEQATFEVDRSRIDGQIEAAEATYSQIVAQLEDLGQQGDIFQPDAIIISHARPALDPSRPQPLRLMLFGALGTSALAVGFVLWRELRQDRLRSVDEIEQATSLPVLGHLPRTRAHDAPLRTASRRRSPDEQLLRAGRKLRASLTALPRTQKVIAGVSALHGEGTSSAMLLLASIFAEAGEKVLLIDLNVASSPYKDAAPGRPDLGQIIAVPEQNPEDLVEMVDGVHLLTAQAQPHTAAIIVDSAAFAAFMDRFRARYDRVLIDMPPVIPNMDFTRALAAADLVLLFVGWNATRRGAVASAVRMLRDVGVKPVGVVATMVNQEAAAGYADDVFAYAGRRHEYR